MRNQIWFIEITCSVLVTLNIPSDDVLKLNNIFATPQCGEEGYNPAEDIS